MDELRIEVTVIIERDGDGFHAYCPNLKGFHVGGSSPEETLENARDGIEAYLISLAKHGDPLPVGPFLNVEEMETFEVPPGAWLKHVQAQWPYQNKS